MRGHMGSGAISPECTPVHTPIKGERSNEYQKWLFVRPPGVGMAAGECSKVDPDKLPSGMFRADFQSSLSQKYPKRRRPARSTRLPGKRYAKFSGKVPRKTNRPCPQVNNVAGMQLIRSASPSTTATVIVNGERVKLSDLKAGDPITIWVAETRFAFYASPGKGSLPTK
jgi:hypothetical protein